MSKDILSFYNYIQQNKNSENICAFITVFNDKIETLPYNIVSSKYLIKYLDIQTHLERCVFKTAFMEYFKFKISQ